MLDFAECERLVLSARDKRSKPVANNTRVEKRSDDKYALRLHATDIATYYRDGRITINSGGWRTVTTAQRLDSLVTHQRYSERGVWYVRCEPNRDDPEPIRGDRTVPKPFHALDPGPEPVRDDSVPEHIAGTETVRVERVEKFIREDERRDGDVTLEHLSGYFSSKIARDETVVTYWREARYQDYYGPNRHVFEHEGDRQEEKQCPHCELFDRQHDAWDEAMHGERWGRREKRGYSQMVENLERFGSREAWQDAYLDDFRAAREARTIHKAWVERNRVPFEDGMEITAEGYAKRPDLKAIAREQRRLKRIEKKKARINRFVADAVAALERGLPLPGAGDCWGCYMRAEDRSIEALGVDHLEQHIRERYYVPSMFVNAMRCAGYRDEGIGVLLWIDGENGQMGGPRTSTDSITRALRRYLYDRLIPEISQHPAAVR